MADSDQIAMAKACVEGDLSTVNEILGKGYDCKKSLKWKDKEENDLDTPPIFIAVDFAHEGVVQAIIDSGFDINLKDENDYTALNWASWNGNKSLVQSLIKQGATVDQECLNLAKEYGHAEVVTLLMEHIDMYAELDGDEDEIMLKATREGDIKMVKQLIENGYDLDKWKEADGSYKKYSPIFIAHKCGHIDILKEFMENGMELVMDLKAMEAAAEVEKGPEES